MLNKENPYAQALKNQKDDLAVAYLPALRALAYRLKERLPSFIEVADLISVGTEELIKLARKYDENLNDSFWGYAKSRVYGAMLDYLRSLDCLSRYTRTLVKKIDYEILKYYNEYQEEPTNEYLSEVLEIEIEKIKEARYASEICVNLPLDEQLNFCQDEKTYDKIEKEELVKIIEQILSASSKNEQLVVQLYYYEELSFKEIAEVLEVSESRVCQIHKAIIKKVREYLAQRGYDG
ncbi:RNA polymerase sigma factor FliA [Helicobacter valdiviensis]|uniref:RNA polymerase sigma factor FliA n=2 Tax=Helicobacter valdiviensis TaxID=1458358 RepID=A0A2W6MVM3_9HELI|nr:RNA polymerase sigma factor FliA [Helicobacter valdiviensis]PZT48574.1 RNA polymerase sigma factor FliA [Helicobacter valdiviensis]